MHETIRQLTSAGPVVTDGAWGTQLQQRGLPVGGCPDAWNLSEPEKVEQVARAYVEAGSQIILTNTFGANRFILGRHGLAEKVAEINRAGVEISRRGADGRARRVVIEPVAVLVGVLHGFVDEGAKGIEITSRAVPSLQPVKGFVEKALALATGLPADPVRRRIVSDHYKAPVVADLIVRREFPDGR